MKYLGLDRKTYSLTVDPKKNPLRNEHASKSKIQYRCGQILLQHFPFSPLLEEVYIDSEGFYFDFFLPYQRIVVEVQGRQHEQQVAFFQTKKDFLNQQNRDNKKAEWCEINNFKLYRVKTEEELVTCLKQ